MCCGLNSGWTFTDGEEKPSQEYWMEQSKEIKARLYIQGAISRLMRGADSQIQMK